MILRIRKVLMVGFLTVTMVLTGMLFYNLYVSFGVAKALANLDVFIQSINITRTDGYTSVSTLLVIQNPSEFAFWVTSLREKLLINGVFVLNSYGNPAYGIINPNCRVEPFSNKTLFAHVKDVSLSEPEPTKNWLVDIYIGLETPAPLSNVVHIRFQREIAKVFP